jgi:hypothetical protein
MAITSQSKTYKAGATINASKITCVSVGSFCISISLKRPLALRYGMTEC